MKKYSISKVQAQMIAKTVVADVHLYAREHKKEFDEFLKMNDNYPHKAVYIDEDFCVKGGEYDDTENSGIV